MQCSLNPAWPLTLPVICCQTYLRSLLQGLQTFPPSELPTPWLWRSRTTAILLPSLHPFPLSAVTRADRRDDEHRGRVVVPGTTSTREAFGGVCLKGLSPNRCFSPTTTPTISHHHHQPRGRPLHRDDRLAATCVVLVGNPPARLTQCRSARWWTAEAI